MQFFFPEDLNRLAPEEVHITALTAEPYADGRRVHVNIEMTPFEKRPHLELTITNASGEELANVSIVEPMSWKLELTMHLRGDLLNPHNLEALLFYPEGPSAAPYHLSFDIHPSPGQDAAAEAP
ncbi:MAG: hypothetical protein ACP5QU_02175, partial [Anaerolineae bacterium]